MDLSKNIISEAFVFPIFKDISGEHITRILFAKILHKSPAILETLE
jgi:hypothetical protein